MLGDITNPRVLAIKGALFILLGLLASLILLLEHPSLHLALLLVIAVWAFCRAYYFAFYVIERYVDPRFRFAGLTSVLRYAVDRRREGRSGRGR